MNGKPIQLLKALEEKKPKWIEGIENTRQMVLSNLAMISQVHAVPFQEEQRASLLLERYIASGIDEPNADTVNNVIGTLPGRKGERRILVFANMDHMTDMQIDQGITITKDKVLGRGVAEDTIALAALITLPDILNRIGLKLDSDLILLATSRSHGRGDLGGIRHFMKMHHNTIDFSLNLVGTPLGNINYFSLSRVRCDISCRVDLDPNSTWGRFSNTSAILAINGIVNELTRIPLPRSPKTVINFGMISGGERYSTISTQAELKLEVLSEDDKLMERVMEEIHDRCMDIGAKYDVIITSDFFGRMAAAGLHYSHPLVKTAVNIISSLGYRPIMAYNNSGLAIPLSYSIPSVCLGITTGEWSTGTRGSVDIAPIPIGLLQIIMLLYAIDKGYCDERDA